MLFEADIPSVCCIFDGRGMLNRRITTREHIEIADAEISDFSAVADVIDVPSPFRILGRGSKLYWPILLDGIPLKAADFAISAKSIPPTWKSNADGSGPRWIFGDILELDPIPEELGIVLCAADTEWRPLGRLSRRKIVDDRRGNVLSQVTKAAAQCLVIDGVVHTEAGPPAWLVDHTGIKIVPLDRMARSRFNVPLVHYDAFPLEQEREAKTRAREFTRSPEGIATTAQVHAADCARTDILLRLAEHLAAFVIWPLLWPPLTGQASRLANEIRGSQTPPLADVAQLGSELATIGSVQGRYDRIGEMIDATERLMESGKRRGLQIEEKLPVHDVRQALKRLASRYTKSG